MNVPSSPNREALAFDRFILSSLDRFMQSIEGLTEQQLNWRPPAANSNSVYALAVHTLGNTEENVLKILCGQLLERQREQEFQAAAPSADALLEKWRILREQLHTAITQLTATDLDSEYLHPRRGILTGREILLVVARHAAEHLGQAELTLDLEKALRR
ncbi:MAG TPA: DinB family protein [Ktedonobacteraceae bacterium]|nr:DinB family protein [Ktedonobacteraceae bacterium]